MAKVIQASGTLILNMRVKTPCGVFQGSAESTRPWSSEEGAWKVTLKNRKKMLDCVVAYATRAMELQAAYLYGVEVNRKIRDDAMEKLEVTIQPEERQAFIELQKTLDT